jgi:hypothetical protein
MSVIDDHPLGESVTSAAAAARRRRRYRADRRLRLYGLTAISLAVGLLGILVATLVIGGAPALTQTKLRVAFLIAPDRVDPADPGAGDYRAIVRDGVAALLPPARHSAKDLRDHHREHPVPDPRRGDGRSRADRADAHAHRPGLRSL